MTQKGSTSGKRSGCLRWGLRILSGLAILLVVLLVTGYVYQTRTTRADFERFPAPGRRVDVGGHSLHVVCQGDGSPTVVVDTGNGDFSLGWGLVQPEVAEFTRICTYDRAGYGWSDPGPEPRTAQQLATELHTLLVNAGVEGPYVLVGHSLGGYTVRMVTHLYPEEVVGMVLVDAGHEEQLTRLPPEYIEINQQQNGYLSVMGLLSRFGVLRVLGKSFGEQALPSHIQQLSEDGQDVYVTMMSHPSYFDATLGEIRVLEETCDQVGDIGGLGKLPLVVLTADNTLNPEALASIGLPPGFPGWRDPIRMAGASGGTGVVIDEQHARDSRGQRPCHPPRSPGPGGGCDSAGHILEPRLDTLKGDRMKSKPRDVVILSAVRTAIGAFGGALMEVPAARLGAIAAEAALERAGLPGDAIDETVFGCARQAGVGPNVARQVAWRVGVPDDRPAYTVNKACASGLKSVTLGMQSILTGENQVVLAGGVEQMSQIPYLLLRARWGYRLGDGSLIDAMMRDGYFCPLAEMAMGETAEVLADRYAISRAAQDALALESHRKAIAAWESGALADEVVPVEAPDGKGGTTRLTRDERPRPDTSLEKLARLRPVFREDGTVTAGNASGIADGAAALVLASRERTGELGIVPMARIVGFASGAVHPREMGLGPVPAVRRLLDQTGLALSDFDLIELNEAFAVQVLAVERELDWDVERRNVHGGAIALGHPTGCSGARILVTLLHALRTHDRTLGLATLCVSGGLGMAMAVERL